MFFAIVDLFKMILEKIKRCHERNSIQTLERVYKHYYFSCKMSHNPIGSFQRKAV